MKLWLKYKLQKCLFLILLWALGATFIIGVMSLLSVSSRYSILDDPPQWEDPSVYTPSPNTSNKRQEALRKERRDVSTHKKTFLKQKLSREKLNNFSTAEASPGLVQMARGDKSWLEALHLVDESPHSIYYIDMSKAPADREGCVYTKYTGLQKQVLICPHSATEDRYISAQLLKDGTWEPLIMTLFVKGLNYYPSCTVLDLGSHVGMYSLVGASLGHQSVGVEPVWASVVRTHKGAWLGNFSQNITLLYHSITDTHMYTKLRFRAGNLGGTSTEPLELREAVTLKRTFPKSVVTSITLDDLKHFVNTSTVIIKMDIEGWECQAILGGTNFLSSHFAPYIFMEWSVMTNNRNKFLSPCKQKHLDEMVRWLVRRDYEAFISRTGTPLHPNRLHTWRSGDIYWKHKTAPALHTDSITVGNN